MRAPVEIFTWNLFRSFNVKRNILRFHLAIRPLAYIQKASPTKLPLPTLKNVQPHSPNKALFYQVVEEMDSVCGYARGTEVPESGPRM